MAAALAAVAAWISFGSLALAGAGRGRTGLLPLDPWHLGLAVLAAMLVLAVAWPASRARATLAAISPLAVLLLPWLPLPVPAAFLLWTGPIVSLVWVAAAAGLAAVLLRDTTFYRATPPRRQCLHAGILSFAVFAIAAWCASPSLPGGDEPHYLVITQSLLYDHDLKIENNHRRGDYHAYFAGDLNPDFTQRGRNGQIYSIHAPGLPALVLPAFAVGGYHGVVVFLLLVAACAAALAWWLAWRATANAPAAWFGWAAVALSAPYLVETYTVYPDGAGAAVVLTGVWALCRAEWEQEAGDPAGAWHPWLLHGIALALLPWMHTRFSVLAATLGGLILVRLARTPNPVAKAIAFLSVPAVSALAWLFFFVVIYGTPDPSAPYGRQAQNSFAYLSNGLGGLLFDQGFGLFATAPVLAIAIAGFVRVRRLGIEFAVVAAPYVLAVATFAMWWAGWSGPARFLVPLVLPLAIPAACVWKSGGRGLRTALLAALVVSVWLSVVMVAGAGGRLAYHSRNESGPTSAPWTEWAARAVDLSSALPAYVPLPVGTAIAARQAAARSGALATLPWLAGCALIGWVAWKTARAPIERRTAAVALSCAGVAMACAAIVWRAGTVDPIRTAASQLTALRTIASGHTLVFELPRYRILRAAEYAAGVSIDVGVRARSARGNGPLAVLPAIPAGDYRLSVAGAPDEGWVMAGIAQDQFAIITQPLAALEAGVTVRFPVDVRSIVVRADEDARDAIRGIELRPIRLVPAAERLTSETSRRAVRYGSTVVFFLDDRAFPEPAGFWVGGARQTSVVVAPDAAVASINLVLRSAPVENRVTLESGAWHDALTLGPEEERQIRVPIDAARGAALIQVRAASGFRPSEADPTSRDARFLGVYVRVP